MGRLDAKPGGPPSLLGDFKNVPFYCAVPCDFVVHTGSTAALSLRVFVCKRRIRWFLNLHNFLWLCACSCTWICISASLYSMWVLRNSVAYFYLLFAEVIYCFGPSCRPESWKAGCLLGRQRDGGAREDVNPNHRLAWEWDMKRQEEDQKKTERDRLYKCLLNCCTLAGRQHLVHLFSSLFVLNAFISLCICLLCYLI